MADIIDRGGKERKIARSLMRVWNKYKNIFLAQIHGEGRRNLPEGYWIGLQGEEKGVIGPVMQNIFREQASGLAEEIAIGFDWSLINERASRWAQQHTFDLVNGIDQTARKDLQQAISQFFEQQMTRGELEDLIASGRGAYSPTRASLIARTEVTRAGTAGEEQMVQELRNEYGIEMTAIWETRNDELVCPVCGPRHGQPRGSNWEVGPPAHPGCRCGLSHELR